MLTECACSLKAAVLNAMHMLHRVGEDFPEGTRACMVLKGFHWSAFLMCVCMYVYINVYIHTAAAAKSLQLCPTLCDPIDGPHRAHPVPGILQARTMEWVAISFSNA